MSLTQLQLAAALAEQVYNRNSDDDPITIGQLGLSVALLQQRPTGLTLNGGLYYSPRGFAGEVVTDGSTVYVVFRGTDLSTSFSTAFADAAGASQTAPSAEGGKVDVGDAVNDILLGEGFSGQSQLTDALALTDAAQTYAKANGNMKVVVVGQSLGGGLASLVSAITGVQGYAIDPAPFENQLYVAAQEQALVQAGIDLGSVSASSFINNPFGLPVSDDPSLGLEAAILAKQIVTLLFPTANVALVIAQATYLLSLGNSPLAIFDYFQDVSSNLGLFQVNMLGNLTVSRVSGELLSSGLLGGIFSASGTQFPVSGHSIDVGVSPTLNVTSAALTVATSLHSPTLYNLLVATEGTSEQFEDLLKGDEELRYSLFEVPGISGPIEGDRADQNGGDFGFSGVTSSGSATGILYRILWNNVGVTDGFYDRFYARFGAWLATGAVAQGLSATAQSDQLSVHSGVVKLGLQVVRDSIVDGAVDDDGMNVFGDGDTSGPSAGYVRINLADIIPDLVDPTQVEQLPGSSLQQEYGVRDINLSIEQQAEKAFGSNLTTGVFNYLGTLFGATDPQVVQGMKPFTNPWQILIVQAGSGALTYDATQTNDSDDDATKSHVIIGGTGGATVKGSSGGDYLVSGGGTNKFQGGGGSDVILGGSGTDTYTAASGNNSVTFLGGGGKETIIYGTSASGQPVGGQHLAVGRLQLQSIDPTQGVSIVVNGGSGRVDTLIGVQNVKESGNNNSLVVKPISSNGAASPKSQTTFDLGATLFSSNDTLDFSQYGKSVYLGTTTSADGTGQAAGLYTNKAMTASTGLSFTGMTTLNLGPGDDKVNLSTAADPFLHVINGGGGNDIISTDNIDVTINLGNGNDTLLHAGAGSVINAGQGKDTFTVSNDILLNATTPQDVILNEAGNALHGAIGSDNTESQMVRGDDGTRYGINSQGQLGIEDIFGNETFVSSYVGGPFAAFSAQLDGILVGVAQILVSGLFNLKLPFSQGIANLFKAYNDLGFTQTGKPLLSNSFDPLVFDLTGDGINLTAVSSAAPTFDIAGTGFGIQTGWIQSNDGFLVLDKNGDGQIDSVDELIGSQDNSGFAALAQYDSNGDGVIDASDPIYSQLQIWQDGNGNGQVDPGELETLAEAGITAINIGSTEAIDDVVAGNTINATGSFVRADGTTGTIADVTLTTNPFNSQFLGDTTVSSDAAATGVNLKGYGTLTDLQVAMTLDPSLIDVVNATLPTLDVIDLDQLRNAALPILEAWSNAVTLPGTTGNPQHSDVAIEVGTDSSGAMVVNDFAYLFTDDNGNTYYKLASGDPVKDADGDNLAQPTFDQVLAQPSSSNGQWEDFTGAEIAFMERYLGTPIPLDQTPANPGTFISEMSGFINTSFTTMNIEAVRLAMQGPLASYFPGLVYDTPSDTFVATTVLQLTPMYEAIFRAAPSDAAGATTWLQEWKPILDVVLGDFARGQGLQMSYAYMFGNMVRAYEATNLPLDIQDAAGALGVPENEIIAGASGSTLQDTKGADIFYLSGGNQTAIGGGSADNYVMGGNFGQDVIDHDQGHVDDSDALLRFTTIDSTDISATRNGIDLILNVIGTDQQVTVLGEFTGIKPGLFGGNLNEAMGISQIAFADGVTWDKTDIAFAVSRPQPDDPIILGTGDMDVLDPGQGGVHYLSGGDGGDVYRFGKGYGYDIVQANQDDILLTFPSYIQLGAGISESDVTFSGVAGTDDLYLTLADGATLRIEGEFDIADGLVAPIITGRVSGFEFADASSISWQQVQQMLMAEQAEVTNGALFGTENVDVIDPGAGTGNHYMNGLGTNDGGIDTYVFGHGYGHDTIDAIGVVQFNADVLESDVEWSQVGSSLVIKLAGSNDSLTVLNQFGTFFNANAIQSFSFADGAVLSFADIESRVFDTATQDIVNIGDDDGDGNDPFTIDVGSGDHIFLGASSEEGAQTFVFNQGDGQDVIDGGSDTIQFGASITPGMVHVTQLQVDNGVNFLNALILTFDGSTDRLVLDSGDVGVVFSDGTTWTESDLIAQATVAPTLPLLLDGVPQFVNSFDGGNFEVDYNIADGFAIAPDPIFGTSTIRISGLDPSDVQIQRVGFGPGATNNSDILISASGSTAGGLFIASSSESVLGFDQIEFDDGTIWTRQQVEQQLLEQSISDPKTSQVFGFADINTMEIGPGDKFITQPADSTASETHTFVYRSGDGFDTIENEQHGGVLAFADIDSTQVTLDRLPGDNLNDLVIDINGANGTSESQVTLLGQFNHSQFAVGIGVDEITFADGVVWTEADIEAKLLAQQETETSGNVTIYGFDASDTLAAGTGNTVLVGGGGDDTYVWAPGDGVTIIEAQHAAVPFGGQPDVDTLRLEGVDPSEVTVARDATPGSGDMILHIAGQKPIILQDQLDQLGADIDRVVFDNGTVWNAGELVFLADGTASAPNGVNAFSFDGANANSTITGTDVSDTYFWGAGDGNDTIVETFFEQSQKADTLNLVGLNPGDLTFEVQINGPQFQQTQDLLIVNNATGETLRIQNQLNEAVDGVGLGLGIERFVFADGTVWAEQQILNHAVYVASPGSDSITNLGYGNLPILATPGVTVLNGDADLPDTYIWQPGDGSDTINDGPDSSGNIDTLVLHNVQASDVTLTNSEFSSDLLVTIGSTGETITVAEQLFGDADGFLPGAGIEQIAFDDGTVWTRAQMEQMTAVQIFDGDQEIFGSSVGNTILAGHGNDTFIGDDNDHTFVYHRGDGNDTLATGLGSSDRQTVLKLADINASDVTLTDVTEPFEAAPADLQITDNITGDTITISNQFAIDENSQNTGEGLTEIVFGDGTVLDRSAIAAAVPAIPPSVLISDNDVTVDLATGVETFADTGVSQSVAGIELVSVSGFNDTVIGDGGTDVLVATGQNDTLIAGTGADTLSANGGGDTLFGNAYGSTLIAGSGGGYGGYGGYGGTVVAAYAIDNVTVDLGSGTGTASINGSSVSDTLIGFNTVIALGQNDTLIDSGGFNVIGSDAGGNTLVAGFFTTALYSNDDVTVDLNANTASVNGSGVSDTLVGEFESATVSGNNDTLIGSASSTGELTANGDSDTLIAGSAPTELSVQGTNDVAIGNGNGSFLEGFGTGAMAVYAIDNVTVDLGAETASVNGSDTSDFLFGFDTVAVLGNNDTLIAARTGGGGGAQVVAMSESADFSGGDPETLIGGGGANTFVYGLFDGDDVIEDAGNSSNVIFNNINSTDVTFSVSTDNADDLLVTIERSGDVLTVQGQFNPSGAGQLQDFTFADGVSLSAAEVSALANEVVNNPPVITITSFPEFSNVAAQTITGTVISGGAATVVGETVTLTDNDATLGTATVQSDGTFSADVTLPNQGDNEIVASVTDSLGNTASSEAVDNELILAPTVSVSVIFSDEDQDGNVPIEGMVTSSVEGAAAGATVTLTDNGTVLGTATVDFDGEFFAEAAPTVDFGSIVATVTDLFGNTASNANDTLVGSNFAGTTLVSSARGNTLVAGFTTTVSYTGDNTTVDFATETVQVNGSSVGDTLVGEFIGAVVTGTNDTLIGGSAFVSLSANGDANTLIAGPGGSDLVANGANDVVVGNGEGNLLENFGQGTMAVYAIDNVTVDLATHTAGVSGSVISDFLFGFDAAAVLGNNDTLIAGKEDDTLFGGTGADTFVYSSAGGNDIIVDAGQSSQLVFSDISSTGVTFAVSLQNTNDLVITIAGTGETVTVQGQFDPSGVGQLQDFTFADGISLNAAQVTALAAMPAVTITSAAEASNIAEQTITGTVILSGAAALVGDTVTLTDGGTTIGTATVQPDGSFSTAVTLPNQGANSIVATVTDSSGSTEISAAVVDTLDTIAPTVTITSAVETSNVATQTITGTVTSGGAAAVAGQTVTLANDGTTIGTAIVRPDGSFSGTVTLPNLGANSIVATVTDSLGNSASSTAVVDTLQPPGYQFVIGQGHVTIDGSVGAVIMPPGIAESDVILQADQFGNLTIGLADDAADNVLINSDLKESGEVVISEIGKIIFSDGSVLNLEQNHLTFTWFGNASNFSLQGADFGANLFDITTGNGSVSLGNNSDGGNGQNTIEYGLGDGRLSVSLNNGTGVLELGSGIAVSDVDLQADQFGDLTVAIAGNTTDSVVVFSDLKDADGVVSSGLSRIMFSDGTVLNLEQNPLTFTWLGNTSDFSLTGADFGANVFDVTAPGGSLSFGNTSEGGNGQNTINYALGSGRLSVSLDNGTGTLDYGPGVTADDIDLHADQFGDLTVTIAGDTADSIVVFSDLKDTNGVVTSGLSRILFSDGTALNLEQNPLTFTWLGNTSNFSLSGADFGANVFDVTAPGGSLSFGNTSQGGNGQNTINYALGSGPLSVTVDNGIGTIDFGPGVTASDVDLHADQFGNLIVTIAGDTTDNIDIHAALTDTNGTVTSAIRQIQFNDGSSIDLTQNPLTFTWLGNTPNFSLSGTNFGANVFDVTAPGGTLSFGNTSQGGNGQNTIEYGLGDGRLHVSVDDGTGVLELGSGIAAGDVDLHTDQFGDLTVTFAGDATDSIVVDADLKNTNGVVTSALSRIVFSDGSSLNLGQNPQALTVTITSAAEASNASSQTITGTVVSGGAGTVVGQSVTLTDNGTTIGTATVEADGSFSANVTLPNQGANSIVATVTDSDGNVGTSAAVVDTLGSSNTLTVSITGAAEASNAAGQTITGMVTPSDGATVVGQTVTLTDNGATLGTTTVRPSSARPSL